MQEIDEIIEKNVSKSKIYSDIAAAAAADDDDDDDDDDDAAAAADFHFQFLSLNGSRFGHSPLCRVGHGSRLGQASAEGSRDPSGLKDPMQNGGQDQSHSGTVSFE